jgi:regulatory protein
VDGQLLRELPLEVCAELQLDVGMVVGPADIRRITDAGSCHDAMDKALGLLSYRPRSESELDGRLRKAGYPPAAARAALDRCRDLGYLDDRAFAVSFVRDRLRLKPKGRRALRSELYRKGIDRDLAEEAIDAGFADAGIDETDAARQVARKRAKALRRFDPEVARRRLTGYLSRRGFPPAAVRVAVDQALPAGGGPPDRDTGRRTPAD